MKTLKELFEVYRPKAKGEQDFVDKHVVIKHKDRNGNGDDVFNGNTKVVDRKKERHGYDVGEDEKVYEEVEELDEAVSVSHHRYLRSHGKKASGSGAWIFTHKMNGNIDLNDDKASHIGKGKFSDAAKSAKAWAKKHGHTTVYVAEEHADEMLRNAILEMAELEGQELTEENLDTLVEALLDEAVKNPYAVGMAAAMKSTGDTPPLKKSTLRKGHEIAKKLTKEDVINRAIEKYVVSESDLPTPAERLVDRLDGLSESHVNTLLDIFNGLNEDNQMKMLSTAETPEGILSLLDFAIQNKGA
ncbi:MAG: hypothetical protein EB127_15620 [Alphaproteobacteria bacterium]|nr:hypothetical protein [Alphaproteobacteria bacterium]